MDNSNAAIEVELSNEIQAPAPQRLNWKHALSEILQTLIMALVLYLVIDAVFARVRVVNISMQPTLYEGNIILVNKLAYKFGHFQTGDIIIFHNPNDLSEDYIKRLIGKPGDTVRVEAGIVSVNGEVLDEPYIAASPQYSGEWLVPENAIFALGDNRNMSSDSHSWGFVPLEDLVGKALFVYWPLDAAKIITHPDLVSASGNSSP
ncbi:MAG: signal peptidase I [Chloroflexi bacterium]|nr:signal peptidase I [Chloroflexota bacterium]